ncbi:HAD domain-containing protein [Duganella sp. BuS-21]|uniref:HAD domain-containing protein n=1 Tax=Duganella sp. BuS-21 TaxID=2943848 RepID=UPI0035A729E4
MLLFLDVDGVLHPDINYNKDMLFSKLPMLEDVLRARPGVEIVISSTWRSTRTLQELKLIFSPDIAPRIIGTTPHWREFQDEATLGTYVRQAEIEQWLRTAERAWELWVALDDQPHLFRPFCPNLLLTNPATGLNETVANMLFNRLS